MRSPFIGALAVCLVVCVASCGTEAPEGPVLEVNRTDYHIMEQGEPVAEFILSSVGTEPVTIANVESDCTCAVVDFDVRTLEPGDTAPLRVRATRPPIGNRKSKVVIESNSRVGKLVPLSVTCWATNNKPRLIDLFPRHIILAPAAGAAEIELQVLAFERQDALAPFVMQVGADDPIVTIEPLDVQEMGTWGDYAQRAYKYRVAAAPANPGGRQHTMIYLQIGDETVGEPRDWPRIPVEVTTRPAVAASPSAILATVSSTQELPTWTVQIHASPDLDSDPLSASVNEAWLAAEYVPAADVEAAGDDPPVGLLTVRVVSRPRDDVSRGSVTLRRKSTEAELLQIPVMVVLAEQ